MIERQIFIKELFNSKNILDGFNRIEFENFKTFITAMNTDLLKLSKDRRITIPINTIREFDIFIILATKRYFCEKVSLNLVIKPELLKDVFDKCVALENKRFNITTTPFIRNRQDFQNKGFKIWTRNNPLWIKIKFNYDNYEEVHSDIVNVYMKKGWRFFDIEFDFISFDELKVGELHKLEFWINQINTWVNSSKDKKSHIRENQQEIIILDKRDKTIFISKDFKLYINKLAFDNNDMLFDLSIHLEDNGEQVDYIELNKLRSYTDARDINIKYIDYYQNWKIMGHVDEVPYITKFIGGRLG